MFIELPQKLILMTTAAFLIGWILSSINGRLAARQRAKRRDPRDDRIRSLEAELRIAQSELGTVRDKAEDTAKRLEETQQGIEKRDNVIEHQQSRVAELKQDLKDSVIKTRELRSELSDRAAESTRAEVKLREVETELSVAQASTDLIATGVLDYSMAPEKEGVAENSDLDESDEADLSKTGY